MDEELRILIIEDLPTDAELCEWEIKKALSGSRFMCVETREDFLVALETFQPAIIISDYMLPRFDGMTALKLAQENVPETPFIILTGSMNEETAVLCMKAGAWDYVIKEHIKRLGPAVLSALQQKQAHLERRTAEEALLESESLFRKLFEDHAAVKLILDPDTGNIHDANHAAAAFYGWPREQLKRMKIQEINTLPSEAVKKELAKVLAEKKVRFEFRHRRADGSIRDVEVFSSKIEANKRILLHSIIQDITERKQAEKHLEESLERLRKAVGTTVQVMVSAIEIRDPYTAGHQFRSADLARAIATEMGLPQEITDGIRMAGSIHDIGKLSIPSEILSKPSKLTDIEYLIVKQHCRNGYEILKDVESPWPLAEVVYQHHERMDGSGYPRNLKGDDILMEARIMAVADVIEAMVSHRPYRSALGMDKTLEEIEKNKGSLYDPAVADACLRLFREKAYRLPVQS